MLQQISNVKLIVLLERNEGKIKLDKNENSKELLKELYGRHKVKTAKDLVVDLCEDASNTFGRILTGPVDYAECVRRVACKVGVSEKDLTNSEEKNEELICQIAFKKYYESLDPAERDKKRAEVLKEIGEENKEIFNTLVSGSSAAFLAVMQSVSPVIIRQVVFRSMGIFVAGQTALNTVRIVTLAVPFLNVLMAGWMLYDIAGPAYRKIVPSVMNIALLRMYDRGVENN